MLRRIISIFDLKRRHRQISIVGFVAGSIVGMMLASLSTVIYLPLISYLSSFFRDCQAYGGFYNLCDNIKFTDIFQNFTKLEIFSAYMAASLIPYSIFLIIIFFPIIFILRKIRIDSLFSIFFCCMILIYVFPLLDIIAVLFSPVDIVGVNISYFFLIFPFVLYFFGYKNYLMFIGNINE